MGVQSGGGGVSAGQEIGGGRPGKLGILVFLLTHKNAFTHRRRNGRDHEGHGPLTFQPKLFLKYFLSFLYIIFKPTTIHQDEESTNLRGNPS